MNDQSLPFVGRDGRIVVPLTLAALFPPVGAAGEVAAHGPRHANPGAVPDQVRSALPSQQAPKGP